MAQANFNYTLACKLPSLGHVAQEGIFGSFRKLERFGRRLVRGVNSDKYNRTKLEIIPARSSTECKCRGSAKCNVGCSFAITTIQQGTSFSIAQNKTM